MVGSLRWRKSGKANFLDILLTFEFPKQRNKLYTSELLSEQQFIFNIHGHARARLRPTKLGLKNSYLRLSWNERNGSVWMQISNSKRPSLMFLKHAFI